MRRKRILTIIAGVLSIGGAALMSSPTYAADITLTIGSPNNGEATDEHGYVPGQTLEPAVVGTIVSNHYYVPVTLDFTGSYNYSLSVKASNSSLTTGHNKASIAPVSSEGEILARMADQWGYRSTVCDSVDNGFCDSDLVSDFTNDTSAVYHAMSDTTEELLESETPVGDNSKKYLLLDFGAGITTNTPTGDYGTTVTVSAVATPSEVASKNASFFKVATMQDMTPEICNSVPTPLSTATIPTNTAPDEAWVISSYVPTISLRDARDDKSYLVAKLADGNCWMVQNLAIEGSTSTDTNIIDAYDYAAGETFVYTMPISSTNGFTDSEEQYMYNGTHQDNTYDATSTNTGGYYAWRTAVANNRGRTYPSAGESTDSICPKGWQLPSLYKLGKASSGSGQFLNLYAAYNSDSAQFRGILHPAAVGRYADSVLGAVSDAQWWTRNNSDSWSAYRVVIVTTSGSVSIETANGQRHGRSVRCVLESSSYVPLNANGGSGGPNVAYNKAPYVMPTREGYGFVGWTTTRQADTTADTTVSIVDDLKAANAFYAPGASLPSNFTSTLYTLWEKNSGPLFAETTMQSPTLATSCSATTVSQYNLQPEVALEDTRDHKIYKVAKLKDGNCWMIQNLALEGSTDSTPHVVEAYDFSSGETFSYTMPISSMDGFDTASTTIIPYVYNGTHLDNTYDSKYNGDNTGGYYSVLTATAQTSMSSLPTQNKQNATTSICPKGWRLPSVYENGGSAGQTQQLYSFYGTVDAFRTIWHNGQIGLYGRNRNANMENAYSYTSTFNSNSGGLYYLRNTNNSTIAPQADASTSTANVGFSLRCMLVAP